MATLRDCEGNPLVFSSGCYDGQVVDTPICYQVDGVGPVLPGVKRITLNADCTASGSVILDQALAPVPNGVETGCINPTGECCDPDSICSLLAQLPVGVPGPADPVVFVTPAGCVLAVPAMATVDCAALQAIFPSSGATAVGDEFYVDRAGSCIRVTVPAMATLCDQIDALDPISPATAAMEIPIRNPGDGVCSTITVQDICDFCTPAFPLLADDGDCAAPSYSFTNNTDSGMFLIPGGAGAVVIGWDNCTSQIEVSDIINIEAANGDSIEVGASINLGFAAGSELQISGAPGTAGQYLGSNGAGANPSWQTLPAVPAAATTVTVSDAGAGVVGVALTYAREDHKHSVSTAAPVTAVGTTNSAGVSTSLARADHLHRIEVGVQDGGAATSSRPNINFIDGSNITITVVDNPGSERADITIAASGGGGLRSYTFQADQFDSPVNADWAVNSLAPAAADSVNAAITVRRFDDTTEEGVGGMFTIPSGATNVVLNFKWRAQTAPGGAAGVQPTLYHRTIPDNAAVGAWSAALNLTVLAVPTNANFQYDSQTITLASLGWTVGNLVQFELTRRGTQGGDTLTGDWDLAELLVEFT